MSGTRAGWMRWVIQIQQRTRSADGGGGGTDTWTTVTNGERRAQITPVHSDVHFAEDQLQEIKTYKIVTRYCPALASTDMRVVNKNDGRIFEIRSITNPLNRNRWHELIVFERKAA